MLKRKTPLRRNSRLERRSRLSPVSPRRKSEIALYRTKRTKFLEEHPLCEVWCKERGFEWYGPRTYWSEGLAAFFSSNELVEYKDAPLATEVHHKGKRRGALLNDEDKWLAVSRGNHRRIEGNLAWARANGFAENF